MNQTERDGRFVGGNETLVRLIQVAQGDPSIREQLVGILLLDVNQRKPALTSFADEMRLRQKPPEFVDALVLLADDQVARLVLQLIQETTEADPSLTHGLLWQFNYLLKTLVVVVGGGLLLLSVVALIGSILGTYAVTVFVRVLLLVPVFLLGVAGGMMLASRSWRAILTCGVAGGTLLSLLILWSSLIPYEGEIEFDGIVREVCPSPCETPVGIQQAFVYEVIRVRFGELTNKTIRVYQPPVTPSAVSNSVSPASSYEGRRLRICGQPLFRDSSKWYAGAFFARTVKPLDDRQ